MRYAYCIFGGTELFTYSKPEFSGDLNFGAFIYVYVKYSTP
jgi:hypothetical protein